MTLKRYHTSNMMSRIALISSLEKALDDVSYDNWVILTRTKRQLRRAVKWMHQVMHLNGFKLALNQSFIGKISRGFDFWGYLLNDTGLIGLAVKTILNSNQKLQRLYEQRASVTRVLQYVKRWQQWSNAGLEHNTLL